MRKAFYYTGKTYQNATFTEKYTRVSRWKAINYNPNGDPYIRHENKRIYIDQFWRDNPTTIKATDGEEVTLAGHEIDVYYKPLFIEIDRSGESCRVYRFEGSETDYT